MFSLFACVQLSIYLKSVQNPDDVDVEVIRRKLRQYGGILTLEDVDAANGT